MAHQDLFSPEPSSDVPTGSSLWSRREDLQGIMGSPAPIPIDPFLDGPQHRTVSSNFSPSLNLSPNLGSERPAVALRSFFPSPPAWPDHHGGARPSFYPIPRPEPPLDLRMNAEQDVWSPLRITGVPPLRPKNQIQQPTTPITDKRSPVSTAPSHDSFQGFASELENQVNGYIPSDSGYSTRSVGSSKSATSSFPMDFGARIRHLPPNIHDDHPDKQLCDIPGCAWAGRCPSDKKKHMLRHEKPFLCAEPGCKKPKGFGTLNDLERHKLSVHGVESERGASKFFKCFGENCPRSEQIWPRYDNFRAHLRRIHGDLSEKELIKKSEEWRQSEKYHQDIASQKPSRRHEQSQQSNAQFNGATSLADGTSYMSTRGISEADVETVQPASLYNDSSSAPFSGSGGLDLSRPHTFGSINGSSQISVDLTSSDVSNEDRPQVQQDNAQHGWNNANPKKRPLARDGRSSAEETRSESTLFRDIYLGHLDLPGAESVWESAIDLFKALEKETKSADSWKDSPAEGTHRGLDTGNVPTFVDLLRTSGEEEKLILQDLIRAGLEKLGKQQATRSSKKRSKNSDSGSSEGLSDKPFVCSHEGCNKRTRRQCEMRKHEIRHQRPYGCTFTNCTMKFGSKNDWKRHENTRHFHHQSWLCREKVRRKNSIEMRECGEVFSRRNMLVDHLRKAHNVNDQNDVSESLKRSRIGPNSQVRFWCGFCGYSHDLESQGLKAIDERFDHIHEHLKKGADMTSWIPPTNENILKGEGPSNRRTSWKTSRSDGTGQEDANKRPMRLRSSLALHPVPVHVTQNTSYERGRRPAKRPRTASSREASPSGRKGSQVSIASMGSQPANSIVAPGPAEQEPTIWEPGKYTNKQIAESLIYIIEPPKVVSVTCCRCENIPGSFFSARYDLANQHCCALCRHEPCQQCTGHHEVQPASKEPRDANKPALSGATT